jgi:hypothetical protein
MVKNNYVNMFLRRPFPGKGGAGVCCLFKGIYAIIYISSAVIGCGCRLPLRLPARDVQFLVRKREGACDLPLT